MVDHIDAIIDTLTMPDDRQPEPDFPGRERFYRRSGTTALDASSRRVPGRPRPGRHRLRSRQRPPGALVTLTISTPSGSGTFEARYDPEFDVLYLRRVGWDGPADRTVGTAGGHAVQYDAHGELVGATLMGMRRIISEHGRVDTPEPFDPDELAPALA